MPLAHAHLTDSPDLWIALSPQPHPPTISVTSAASDIGTAQPEQSAVTAQQQRTAFRMGMIAVDITAVPLIMPRGDTTRVEWQGRDLTECTVTGTNGDIWEGTAGDRLSGPIIDQTTYTLTCTALNGTTVTDSVTVSRIPRTPGVRRLEDMTGNLKTARSLAATTSAHGCERHKFSRRGRGSAQLLRPDEF